MLVLALAGLGAGLLTGVLNASGAGALATPAEALMWGAAGVGFARVFSLPMLALAVPLLVAGIELGTGAAGTREAAEGGDPLSLALPGGRRLEVTDVVFACAYGWWAVRLGFRREATWLGLAAALVLALATSRDVPALTALAVAFLGPNLDRVAGALRRG